MIEKASKKISILHGPQRKKLLPFRLPDTPVLRSNTEHETLHEVLESRV